MAGVNKVILVGFLGKDPEVRFTQGGQPVAQFTLATSESWNDKQGQKQSRVEWHRVVIWGKMAEVCGEHLAKGSQVYLEGKLQTREWEKDGQKNKTTEIVAYSVQFLGEKAGSKRDAPSPARERAHARDLGYRLPGEDEDPF